MTIRMPAPLLATMLFLVACSNSATDPDPGGTPTEPGDGPGSDPGTAVDADCRELGFACTPSEVSDAVMKRSSQLLEEVSQKLGARETIAEVAEWLESQDGMRLVMTGDHAIIFILEGGLPIGTYDAIAATGGEELASAFAPAQPEIAHNVVGTETPRERADRKKRALVLSPFEWEYVIPDAGRGVAQTLRGISDYGSQGVTYLENEEVGVNAFFGWDEYDVIVLNGHGGSVDGTDRRTGKKVQTAFVVSGTEQSDCEELKGTNALITGIFCLEVPVTVRDLLFPTTEKRYYVAVLPRFFTTYYPTGLDKAVIVINTCRSVVFNALPVPLAGSSSTVFGWTADVRVVFGLAIIPRLVKELATGLPAEVAYNKVCANSGCLDINGRQAELKRFGAGPDLRIRDLPRVVSPFTSGAAGAGMNALSMAASASPLVAGSSIPFIGQVGDGFNDDVLLVIEVEGIEPGSEGGYTARVLINGEPRGEWSLDSPRAKRVDEYTIRIRETAPLGFDAQKDQTIEVRVEVDLPEGGTSETEITLVLANPVLDFESRIETIAPEDDFHLTSVVRATLDLSFADNPVEERLEFDESEGVLEYVSLQVSGIPADCSTSSELFDGKISVADGNLDFSDPQAADFGVPEELVIRVHEISERLVFICNGFAFGQNMIHWFAGFVTFHSGGFGDENEFDEERGGIVVRNWLPGSGDTYATRTYDREAIAEEVRFRERTTLSIRGPQYP